MTMIPTVHWNGDTQQTLTDQNMAVYRAADKLLTALNEAGPNGRNFYPQGPQALWDAQVEHKARWEAVNKIKRDMEEIILAIQT